MDSEIREILWDESGGETLKTALANHRAGGRIQGGPQNGISRLPSFVFHLFYVGCFLRRSVFLLRLLMRQIRKKEERIIGKLCDVVFMLMTNSF